MSRRQSKMLWLKDLVEHLSAQRKRLEWTEDPQTVRLLTDSMLRDLERCKSLVETIRVQADATTHALG